MRIPGHGSSIEGLIQIVNKLIQDLGGQKPLLWRGQADQSWSLQPSIDRQASSATTYAERLAEEQELIREFRDRSRFLLGSIEQAYMSIQNHTSPLVVMQHYGAPTRLLDWTHSPQVALFVASITEPGLDGAAWWINGETLELTVDRFWDRHGMRDASGTVDPNRWAFSVNSRDFLMPFFMPMPFPRIAAQQGCFLLPGRLGCNFEEVLDQMGSECGTSILYGKITFPSQLKTELLKTLQLGNVTAASLDYPGADLVGRSLAQKLHDSRTRTAQ